MAHTLISLVCTKMRTRAHIRLLLQIALFHLSNAVLLSGDLAITSPRSYETCPEASSDPAKVAFRRTLDCDNEPLLTFTILPEPGTSGGFGDRLKGMVTTFYQALMTDSSFSIDWTRPYDLGNFFSLNRCSRASNDGEPNSLRRAIDSQEWTYILNGTYKNDIQRSVRIATNSFQWLHIVRDPEFRDRARVLGLLPASHAKLFKMAVDSILECPHKLLREAYGQLLLRFSERGYPRYERRMRIRYVGVQLRLGGDRVVGWEDPPRHSMQDVFCFVDETLRLCQKLHVSKVFITSDSKAGADLFKRTLQSGWKGRGPLKVVETPGIITHTDRSVGMVEQGADAWTKSILDWLALRHAAALVVSESGFGQTAAWASDALHASTLALSSEKKCHFFDARVQRPLTPGSPADDP